MPPRRARDQQDDDVPPPPPPPQLTPYERASMDMLTGITRMLERKHRDALSMQMYSDLVVGIATDADPAPGRWRWATKSTALTDDGSGDVGGIRRQEEERGERGEGEFEEKSDIVGIQMSPSVFSEVGVSTSSFGLVGTTTFWISGGDSAMPPRRRGRGRGQFQHESEGQNEEEVQHSIPRRGRDRHVDLEVDELAARVGDMELVMARFQRMNPQTFNGDEPSSDAESWLQHITGLFDRVRYDDERRLAIDMLIWR
ncbi:putative leucine-rich repeat receptor-like protein kinase [Dorcoceras hygrometricum]|uniref:Putative leucine-rich repeat receptor-like protein kinase n=1 Tax=Dorcoceras hygrometricum TaxID=472368 RepID=A0A2Z7BUT8_9LAMI|nr:putative leucine-rich repeat receptor-like protein kinase [Dorcoceras hygrometricum]